MTKRLAVLAVLAVAAVGTAQAAGYDPIETRQAGQDLLAGTFNGIKALVASKGDMKAADELATESLKLADFAKGGDTDALTAQIKVVGDACASCHKTFRAR